MYNEIIPTNSSVNLPVIYPIIGVETLNYHIWVLPNNLDNTMLWSRCDMHTWLCYTFECASHLFQSTFLSQHTLTQSITSNTSNRVPIKKIAPLPPHIPMVDTFPEKCPPQRSPVVTFPLFCTSDHINYKHILTEYIFHDSPPSHSLKKSNSPSQPPISVLAKARHFGQECKTHI